MQSQKPRRGQRIIDQTKELGIPIHTFKDFINCKLDYALPEDYEALTHDQKKEAWRQNIKKLKQSTNKLSYQLPDNRTKEDVDLIIEVVSEENQGDYLDWEYEEMFLGNKKQLVVFKKCKQLNDYLQKYRLPKSFEPSLKEVEAVSKSIFELKIQRNIAISLRDQQKIGQLATDAKKLEQKFEKSFSKFEDLMKKILVHFKGQSKRVVINIEALRESIYMKLKPLGEEHELYVCNKYPDIDNDEFLAVQILKKNDFDRYYEEEFKKEISQKPEEIENYTDKSSNVSDESEAQQELNKEKKLKKTIPPEGIYAVLYQKYEKKILTLRISFETPRNKLQYPTILQYGTDKNDLRHSIEIEDPTKDISIQIPLQKGGFLSYFFRTKNEAGCSPIKNFKYFLRVNLENQLFGNGSLKFIGENKFLIPPDRVIKQGDYSHLNLAVCDFSMSSTQVIICDVDGNAADWGLFMQNEKQGKRENIVEENQLFKIINNKDSMLYQQPGIRFEKQHYKVIKAASGPGFTMVLDAYGSVWVFGKNHCGQLGIKDQTYIQDPIQINFFEQNKIFVTDIKTSESLASFAIDSNGTLYKWGVNQFHSTNQPIYDNFGKLLNYSLENYLQEQWVPIPVKKHFGNEKIVQIEAGNEFYMMLNNEATLYGWGQCRNLGKGVFKDGRDEEIENICNEVQLMQNVQKISVGRNHAIAVKKDGKIYGWGNLECLSDLKKEFSDVAIDLTEEYGLHEDGDQVACGPNYTCLYKKKEAKVKLIGETEKFAKKEYEMKKKVRKIECEQEVIAILTQNDIA